MPELRFIIQWPDGSRDRCYSPSTIVREHFTAGTSYPLPVFVRQSRDALHAASERVLERWGSPCAQALQQLALIETKARRFTEPDASILFETFEG